MARKKQTVFVVLPPSKSSDAVYQMVASAIARVGIQRIMRPDSIGSVTQGVQKTIREASLIIADVSDGNANVMYEVGFAQAQKKPVLLISESGRSIPFDLSGFRVLIYDITDEVEFIERLEKAVKEGLRSPNEYILPDLLSTASRERLRVVFVSYSHSDRQYLDRLLVHLKLLEKEGLIDLWVDTRLKAGDRWRKEIDKALKRASVAILLISADFLASDFIVENELPPVLKSAEEDGTRILPLILKPCRFTRDKNLRSFQALNDPAKALVLLNDGEQERLYDQLAAEVERTLRRQ